MDILGLGMADGAELRVAPDPARRYCGSPYSRRGRGTRRTFAQIVAEEAGDLAGRHRRGGTGTPTRTAVPGSVPMAPAPPPVSGAGHRRGGPQGPATRAKESWRRPCSRSPWTTWSGRRGAGFVAGDPDKGRDDPGDRASPRTAPLELPEGVEGAPGRDDRVQPAEPDVPVRGVHLRRRRGPPGNRSGEGTPVSSRLTTAACGSTRWWSRGRYNGGPSPTASGMALMEVMAFDEDGQLPRRFVHGPTCCRPRWSARRGSSARRSRPPPHHPNRGERVSASRPTVRLPGSGGQRRDGTRLRQPRTGWRHADMPLTPVRTCGGPSQGNPIRNGSRDSNEEWNCGENRSAGPAPRRCGGARTPYVLAHRRPGGSARPARKPVTAR